MSTPPRKKKTTQNLTPPAGGPRPGARKKAGRGKKKKKKPASMLPQIVAGVTLLGVVGGMVALSAYLAQRALPEVEEVKGPETVSLPRPSVEPRLPSRPPKRPGLVAHMPDETYFPKATDVAGTAIEPPVQGLLARGVITVFVDGKFRPEEPVTRAQFVSWCYNAVMAQSVPGPDPFVPVKKAFPSATVTGEEFGDVSAEHWAAGVLASVKASGILGARPTSYFRPDAPLTREEWLQLASYFAASTEQKAQLGQTLDEKKLEVAYRQANYTDYDKLKAGYKPYAQFVFGDEKRRAWLGAAFTPPVNPGPWSPAKPVMRGEAAAWIGESYERIGNGAF